MSSEPPIYIVYIFEHRAIKAAERAQRISIIPKNNPSIITSYPAESDRRVCRFLRQIENQRIYLLWHILSLWAYEVSCRARVE